MLVADPARWEHERGPYRACGTEGMDLIRVGGGAEVLGVRWRGAGGRGPYG